MITTPSFETESCEEFDLPPPPQYNPNAKAAHIVRLSSKSKKKSLGLNRWTCPKCTLSNTLSSQFCKACNYSRFQNDTKNHDNTGRIEIVNNSDYECIDNLDENVGLKYIMYICCILGVIFSVIALIMMFMITNDNVNNFQLYCIICACVCFVVGSCLCVFVSAVKFGKRKQQHF